MTGNLVSRGYIGQARRAWKEAERRGELEWLDNPDLIPASCFAAPAHTSHRPRAWERVPVPCANGSRRSNDKIYKRITASPKVDHEYQAALVELQSQGFGERKRARAEVHVRPYGDALFEEIKKDEISGQERLDIAREKVMSALRTISKDNIRLRNTGLLRVKRSTYDPALLTWIPRKRHNTRWPVNPPDETCDFIAELQPLIKFELHPSQIDETQDLQQQNEDQRSPIGVATPEHRAQKIQKHNRGHGRRTLRPSLSTISEADDEPPAYPVLIPGGQARPVYVSPAKGMNGADRFKTPTKVADSPMKVFSITATHVEGDETIEITNLNGHLQVSTPTKTDITRICLIGTDHPGVNHEVEHHAPSDICIEATDTAPASSSAVESGSSNNIVYLSALPFFDAPVPATEAHDEPRHEVKRRISLDNARRSDRRSDAKILKRVHHWMEGTTASKAKKRRYSELPEDLALSHKKAPQRRRHTLDVDVGRNLDIFGQQAEAAAPVDAPPIPNAPCFKSVSVNPSSWPPNANISVSVPSTALTNDGGDAVMLKAEKTRLQSFADVEFEVEMDTPEEEDEITGAADQVVSAANDRTTCAVAEQAEIDGMAAEQHGPQKSDVHQMENAPTSNGGIFSDKEETVDGDSALADLHSFVRRARSSKERKDIPATAPAYPLTTSSITKKRCSGSLGSATSESESPKNKLQETTTTATTTMTSPRVPLGQKDANKSPSPSKKRKLTRSGPQEATAPLVKKVGGRLVAPDFEDHDTEASAQPKKRRRKVEADSGGGIFNPDMFPSQDLTKPTSTTSGPTTERDGLSASRRSSRIATVKKTAAVPVRLPGSSTLDLGDMPAPSTAAVTARKAGEDLAYQTRANTNMNRGTEDVAFVLAKLGDVVVGKADQHTASVAIPKTGTKNVRWDEILARVQGEEVPNLTVTKKMEGAAEEEEEMALPLPPQLRFASNSRGQPRSISRDSLANCDEEDEEDKEGPAALSQAPVRRSARSAASRLPTRGGSVTPVKKKSALPSLSPGHMSKSTGGSAAGVRARLGMAGPGTPGPRRGGRRR